MVNTSHPPEARQNRPLVAIVGPTGAGKSLLAIRLAQDFGGEIVGADSRQVYRQMDIGTAKPTPAELAQVRHHLVGFINPDEDFSLSEYQRLAYLAVDDIHSRGRLPFLVGGSGLYVWAVLEGWQIPPVTPNAELRRNLENKAAHSSDDELYRELRGLDPDAAAKIDRRNLRRTIRALEVIKATGQRFSALAVKKPPGYQVLIIGLTRDRHDLYAGIDLRVDKMIEQGLVAEVEKLYRLGFGPGLPSMSAVGYKQVGCYLRGEQDLRSVRQQMKAESHRLVRHQYGWFRLSDSRIHWLDASGDCGTQATALISRSLDLVERTP